MEVAELIDYASPAMKAEKAMHGVHKAMLARDYERALELAIEAQVEMRMTYNAIKHEKETQNVIR